MEVPPMNRLRKLAGKPFAALVVFGGLVFVGLALLGQVSAVVASGSPLPELAVPVLVFGSIFLITALVSLTARRWAYGLAAGLSIVFVLLFLPTILVVSANPAHPGFWLVFSAIPILFLVAAFATLLVANRKRGMEGKAYLTTARSAGGLATVLVIGLVIGAVVVGQISAALIGRILSEGGPGGDVTIVRDATAPNVAEPFRPQTFTVAAGTPVTWFNGDTLDHTVTSDDGTFDSGNLPPGARWTHTFTQPGTYPYHCEPHPWMTGTIVVT